MSHPALVESSTPVSSSDGVRPEAPTLPAVVSMDSLAVGEQHTFPSHVERVPLKRKSRRGIPLKAPKDSKVYKVAMAYVALRAQGIKLAEIAERLAMSKDTVSTYVKRATKKGWLNLNSFENHDDQVDVLTSKAIRNVNEYLDERDKDVTVEAAKGLGIFKNHQAVKVDTNTQIGFALRVDVVMPSNAASSSPIVIRPGSLGGQPAIDGQVIDQESE